MSAMLEYPAQPEGELKYLFTNYGAMVMGLGSMLGSTSTKHLSWRYRLAWGGLRRQNIAPGSYGATWRYVGLFYYGVMGLWVATRSTPLLYAGSGLGCFKRQP